MAFARRKTGGLYGILILLSLPLIFLFGSLLKIDSTIWQHLQPATLLDYSLNSLVVAVSAAILSLVIGTSAAWAVTRYEFPLRRVLEWLLIFPKAIPAYIAAYCYRGIFDYTGVMGQWGLGSPSIIASIPGLIFVLSMVLYPYVYLAARAAFKQQSANLLEASHGLSCSQIRLFFSVGLPLSSPAILGAGLLVFMETLNEYGAALYLGVNTLTTGIFRVWSLYYDFSLVFLLSSLLITIVLGLLVLEHLIRPKFRLSPMIAVSNQKRVARKWSISLFLSVGLPIFLGFLIPFAQLLYWALLRFTAVSSTLLLLGKSLLIAGAGALLSIGLAVVLATHPRIMQKNQHSRSIAAIKASYAIPGAVTAAAVLTLMSGIGWTLHLLFTAAGAQINPQIFLGGSLLALMYGYLVRYMMVAFIPLHTTFSARCQAYQEASCALGKRRLFTMFSVHLPIMKYLILASGFMVFIDILKDLPLTILLRPFNFDTLAVRIHELISAERITEAAFPSLILIILGLLPVILLIYVERLCRITKTASVYTP